MEYPGFIQKVFEKLDKLDQDKIKDIIRKLSAEKELYKLVFDSMIEGVIVTDWERKVILVNKAMEQFISIPRKKIVNTDILECKFIDKELESVIEDAYNNKEKILDREIHISRSNKTFLLTMLPLKDEREEMGHIIILVDITEKKQKELQLRRAESLAALTTLSAGVAHEIKNPLTSIDIHIQLLKREISKFNEKDVKNIKKMINIVKEEIDRLNSIVQDFLFAVRPMSVSISKENVNDLIVEIIDFLKYELEKSNIKIKYELEENLPPVIVDPKYFHQALLNIIKNAMQSIHHDHGEITIKTEEDISGDVLIHIIDNGEGIPDNMMPKIFEPYFTTRKSGTGLGLVIVYKIVKELGGDIRIKSKVGEGTTFTLKMPVLEKKKKLLTYEVKDETKVVDS